MCFWTSALTLPGNGNLSRQVQRQHEVSLQFLQLRSKCVTLQLVLQLIAQCSATGCFNYCVEQHCVPYASALLSSDMTVLLYAKTLIEMCTLTIC